MAGSQLAEWFVTISAQGVDAVDTALTRLREQLVAAEAASKSFRTSFMEHVGLSRQLLLQQEKLAQIERGLYDTGPYRRYIETKVRATQELARTQAQQRAMESTAGAVYAYSEPGRENLRVQADSNLVTRVTGVATQRSEAQTKAAAMSSPEGIALLRQELNLRKELQAALAKQNYAVAVAEQGRLGAALGAAQTQLGKLRQSLEGIGALGAQVFGTLVRGVGQMLQVADPGGMMMLNFAFRDLAAVVGVQFIPVLEKVTQFVRNLADAILNLDEGTKQQIVTWVEWAAGIAGVAMVLPRIVGGIQAVISVVGALRGVFQAFNLSTGGMLVAIGVLVSLFAALAGSSKQAGGGVGGIMGALRGVVAALKPLMDAFGRLFQALQPIFEKFGSVILKLVELVIPVFTKLVDALTWVVEKLAWIMGQFAPGSGRPGTGVAGSGLSAGDLLPGSMIGNFFTSAARPALESARIPRPAGPSGGVVGLLEQVLATTRRSAEGMGGTGGSITSVEGAWERAQQAAFQTPGARAVERTAEATEGGFAMLRGIARHLEDIRAQQQQQARPGLLFGGALP